LPTLLDRLKSDLAGRYAIEKELAVGGMATVFAADDLRHERSVAIKVMRPELAAALGAERFLREIRIAANLTHPRILPLHDSGEAGGSLFYVMPRVMGETLQQKLEREKQLSLDEALRIARQVADALSYAHGQGVIHRDIKPANILIDAGHAVVADFGLARAVTVSGTRDLTEVGVVMGTPSYMSPEQAGGDDELDGRSDIYSLGCVLYEMLAGNPPFVGPSSESVVIQHVGADPPSISTVRANVPPEVAALLHRALQKIPADRMATARQFAEGLETASAHLRVSGPIAETRPVKPVGTRKSTADWPVKPLWLGVAIAAVLGMIFMLSTGGPSNPAADGITRMSVIPFENLGAADREYFAAGIADEITARLAGVEGLSVIARQSATEYTASSKSPQQIGNELGVDYLLMSTISWEDGGDGSSRVRVRPQLVRTEDGSSVWGAVYDEDLTGVFEVQTNIAEQVVEALGVALLEPARAALAAEPTSNLDAYDYYLRGHEYFRRPVSEANLRVAADLYGQALGLDPDFAEAAARLSIVHSLTYWYYYDRSQERLDAARQAAELALSVAPGLVDGHLAMGELHYRGYLDYAAAMRELDIVRATRPDDSDLLINIGGVERRRGNWLEAATVLGRASDLDIRRASNAVQAGLTHVYLRDYAEARRYFERAISVAPEQLRPRVWMARMLVSSVGDTAAARAHFLAGGVLDPRELDPQPWWHWALFRVLDGASEENFRRLQVLRVEADSAFLYTSIGELHALGGEPDRSRVYYDSARVVLEGRLRQQPDDPRFHSELGLAYAGLGRVADAIREGERATTLQPISREAVLGPDWVRNLAQVYTMGGMQDEAVEQLGVLLSTPSTLSAHWLRLDPIWASLRGHAGFEQLISATEATN
jgi:TolB-like protein/Flp pilus assembly protein TadD